MANKKIFHKSANYIYTVYSNGKVSKTWQGAIPKETMCHQFKDDGGTFVWVGKKKQYIKVLVAKHFHSEKYKPSLIIEFIDGNDENCNINNLRIVKRDNSSKRKIYTKVWVDGVEFVSIAAAERALFVSNGYLTKYFKGKVSGAALEGHEVRLSEKDGDSL